MQLSNIGWFLRQRWYLVLLALATFESWTSRYLVKWFGEPFGWAALTLLIVLSLYSILWTPKQK